MFDVQAWRDELQRRLRGFLRQPRQEPAVLGTQRVFWYLASRTLEPFFEAFTYQPLEAVVALGELTRSEGTKYLIHQAVSLRYQQHRLWRELEHSTALRQTVEQLLVKLGVIEYVIDELDDVHVEWFRVTLGDELGTYRPTSDFAALRQALHEVPWQERYSAIQTLHSRNGVYSPDDLSTLQVALTDRSAHVRAAAARQLGSLKTDLPSALRQVLFQTALYDRDIGTRYAAARAIGDLHAQVTDDDAREILTTALFHEDSFVRSAASLTLGQLGEHIVTPTIVDSLLVVLRDDDSYAREAAATALGTMGADAATRPTLDALVETLLDTDPYVHEAALAAVAALKPLRQPDDIANAFAQIGPGA